MKLLSSRVSRPAVADAPGPAGHAGMVVIFGVNLADGLAQPAPTG
jgi:hypothetical protein